MDDYFKLGGALCPGVDQLHSPVKVLHILAIHLEEGCQLLQDVSDAWVAVPGVEAGAGTVLLILVPQNSPRVLSRSLVPGKLLSSHSWKSASQSVLLLWNCCLCYRPVRPRGSA